MLSILISLLAVFGSAWASENGIDGFSTRPDANGGASCLACHTQAPDHSASVEISGPTRVEANSINEYTVTLTGGPAKTAGINIAVFKADGTLSAIDGDLRRSHHDLTHRQPKPFSNGQVQFRFHWRAPAYNAITTIHAAANSSNAERNLIDDAIASTGLQVTIRNGSGTRPADEVPGITSIKLETVATGLGESISIANAGDARMFIVEKNGKIRLIDANGEVQQQPFLDIGARVESAGGEQGLLGLAFDPDYARNGYFYVHYTRRAMTGSIFRGRVSRFSVGSDRNFADEGSEKVLLEIQRNQVTHNGGAIQFGKDGYLYIASGDGGEPLSSQNRNSLQGKILRIDVHGTPDDSNRPDCGYSPATTYRIPPGNAFRNGAGGGCDEIFALGLRNPWRLSLDRKTGDLWVGDVGRESQEEINRISSSASGGVNLGWPCREGTEIFDAAACSGEYLEPVHTYGRGVGRAVMGGYVYRGTSIPRLNGRYLFTDYGDSSKIYSLASNQSGWTAQTVLSNSGASLLSSFGEDAKGELYVLSAAASELYRIVDGETGSNAKFELSSVTASESQSRATLSVTLSEPVRQHAQVSIATLPGTATPGLDFYGSYQTLRFPIGTRRVDLDIPIINDSIAETNESLDVRLFHPSGARIGTETARVTIVDDDSTDALPVINVRSARASETAGQIDVTISLSSPATNKVTFAYSTANGTAITGVDFYGNGGQASIAPGRRHHRIPVQLADDESAEAMEHFLLRIVNVRGAVAGALTGRIDIIDND